LNTTLDNAWSRKHNGQYEAAHNVAAGASCSVPRGRKQHSLDSAAFLQSQRTPSLNCWLTFVCVRLVPQPRSEEFEGAALAMSRDLGVCRSKGEECQRRKESSGMGDIWTWTGIDADTKLIVSYLVGGRDGGWARILSKIAAKRIRNRVQVTTDGHKVYLDAVENAFGADIDYAELQKIYGAPSDEETRRYSPAKCIG
jgi:hypothetical protein